jgi:hypothetical protein
MKITEQVPPSAEQITAAPIALPALGHWIAVERGRRIFRRARYVEQNGRHRAAIGARTIQHRIKHDGVGCRKIAREGQEYRRQGQHADPWDGAEQQTADQAGEENSDAQWATEKCRRAL